MNRFKTTMQGTSALALALAMTGTAATAADWASELGDWSGTTLRVQSINDPFVSAFDEIKGGFTELTGAEVEMDSFGYDPTHEKEILNCSQRSSDYDILFVDGIWLGEFVEAGCVTPVEDL